MNKARRFGWCTMAIVILAGCSQSGGTVDPELLAAHRDRLVLAEEPDGAVGVLDVRENLAGTGEDAQVGDEAVRAVSAGADLSAESGAVVVIGRIGGVPNPWKQTHPDYPWKRGQAEFVMADAAAAAEVEEHGSGHDDPDHDCPFCAKAANSEVVAVVRFQDQNGKTIPLDARELFDLDGDETVVVRGKAHLLGDSTDGVLVVDADGLYIRR